MKLQLRPSIFSSKCTTKKSFQTQTRHITKFDTFTNFPIPPNKAKFVPTSGTYPQGFKISSISVGIKPASKSQPDLVLLVSEIPSNGAAVFTKNAFPAPSITVSKEIVKRTKGEGLRGVITNSWCANLFTGRQGLEDSGRMSREAGKYVSGDENGEVVVMHTGMGGKRLPLLHSSLGNTHSHFLSAAHGLLTTDTFPKLLSRTFSLPSSPSTTYSIAGLTKGSGMIHPNMATTLGILFTDASIAPPALQSLLSFATERSYNCISVEGDNSTNDMVTLFSNGAASPLSSSHPPMPDDPDNKDFEKMKEVLMGFMQDLAKLVARDGEGSSKFITIRIRGAPSFKVGRHISSSIARSVLFKTGMSGREAAWGNVITALGQSLLGTEWESEGVVRWGETSVSFCGEDGGVVKFFDRGVIGEVDEERVTKLMEGGDVEVLIELRDGGSGEGEGEEVLYWTCDLTQEFVELNS